MIKINKRIEIVSSPIAELSSMSLRSRLAIESVLSKNYQEVSITLIHTLADLEALVMRKPDLVFLGMKFIPSDPALGFQDPNRIWISEYLEQHNIAYTGSGKVAHEREQNKPLAKQAALKAGLKTSPYYVAKRNEELTPRNINLKYPLFVKPTDRGGGQGIDASSVVYNFEQLLVKVKYISRYINSDSLIEEYLPGREISVAILANETPEPYSVMPIERIVPPNEQGVSILSPDVKHADAGLSVVVTDKAVCEAVSTLALDVFHAIGAKGYGRIDTRMDEFGVPHFLEANLIPSLIEGYGNFPKSCVLNIGLEYEPMIMKIATMAMASNALDLASVLETTLTDEAVAIDPLFVPEAI